MYTINNSSAALQQHVRVLMTVTQSMHAVSMLTLLGHMQAGPEHSPIYASSK